MEVSLRSSLSFLVLLSSVSAFLQSPRIRWDNLRLDLALNLYQQSFVLDGGLWKTLSRLEDWKSPRELWNEDSVTFTLAVGRTEEGERRVGVVISDDDPSTHAVVEGVPLLADALVPSNSRLSDAQITSTYYYSMLCHAVLPQLAGVVGDADTTMVDGKVIILGGSSQALSYASALTSLGVTVTIVSTRGVKTQAASMDPKEDSFCERVGQFDAILDTIGDCSNQPSILKLLSKNHRCHTYLSTHSKAQSIVGSEGLLWGPGAADKYRKQAAQQPPQARYHHVPALVGRTVEQLLSSNIKFDVHAESVVVPSWTMGDTMEGDFWPMDKWGANTVRFGFPTQRRETFYDVDEDTEWAAPPTRVKVAPEEPEDADGSTVIIDAVQTFVGTKGLQDTIERPQRDGILFLSAPYCRTCRRLGPRYKKWALSEATDQLLFCQADATGLVGKELGRQLGVDSVPSFVFFRNGRIFGEPMGVTKLPHPRLSKAMDLLQSGADWDEDAVLNASAMQE